MYSVSIGTCNDHKVRVLPGVNGGADFLDHFIHRDDLLSLHMPAFLGPNLVFDMQAGNACALILMNGTPYVDRVAIASISVCDERQGLVACDGSDDSRMAAARLTISLMVSRPTSGCPRTLAAVPKPVM